MVSGKSLVDLLLQLSHIARRSEAVHFVPASCPGIVDRQSDSCGPSRIHFRRKIRTQRKRVLKNRAADRCWNRGLTIEA